MAVSFSVISKPLHLILLCCCASLVVQWNQPCDAQGTGGFAEVIDAPPTELGIGYQVPSDTQVNIGSGGRVGRGLQAGNRDGSSANVEVNLLGGQIDGNLRANSGSTANLNSGSVAAGVYAGDGSTINMRGANLDSVFRAESGSTVNVTGGNIGRRFEAGTNSQVSLTGGEFKKNGNAVTSSVQLARGDVLTGTLQDGATFIIRAQQSASVSQTYQLNTVSLPSIDTLPRTVEKADVDLSKGLRNGQSLIVKNGAVVGINLNAVGASVAVEGGSIDRQFEISESNLTVSGGTIGRLFNAVNRSDIHFSGGEAEDMTLQNSDLQMDDGTINRVTAFGDSMVQIDGGQIENSLRINSGSTAVIRGGDIGHSSSVTSGGSIELRGGTVGRSFRADEGLDIYGGEFKLNGSAVSGNVTLSEGDILTGTLQDGTPFAFASEDQASDNLNGVSLNSVPLPDAGSVLPPVTASTVDAPRGLRAGQSLTVESGGVLGRNFAVVDADLILQGGTLGQSAELVRSSLTSQSGVIDRDLLAMDNSVIDLTDTEASEIYLRSNSVLNIDDGSMVQWAEVSQASVNVREGAVDTLTVSNSAVANVTGGTVDSLRAREGASVNVTGGIVDSVTIEDASLLATGGRIEGSVRAESGSQVTFDGTTGMRYLSFESGSQGTIRGGKFQGLGIESGSDVELVGGEFTLNGNPVSGSVTLSRFDNPNDLLTGTLQDGSTFAVQGRTAGSLVGGIRDLQLRSVDLPVIDMTPIVVNTESSLDSLRSGQRLTVNEGGAIPTDFTALDSEVQVNGGSIVDNGQVVRTDLTVNGGKIGDGFRVRDRSTAAISDGEFGTNFSVDGSSTATISGGRFGLGFGVGNESVSTISGGTFGFGFRAGENTTIQGGEFRLDGQAIDAADLSQFSLSATDYDSGALGNVLTGTLADGSPFILRDLHSDRLFGVQLESVDIPALSTQPITISDDSTIAPAGLRAGQSLTLEGTGRIAGNFSASDANLTMNGGVTSGEIEVARSTAQFLGGKVQSNLFATAGSVVSLQTDLDAEIVYITDDSKLSIAGGTQHTRSIQVDFGSELTLDGGEIVPGTDDSYTSLGIGRGSTLTFRDGLIERYSFGVYEGSVANLEGGTIRVIDDVFGRTLSVQSSVVNLSGGTIDADWSVYDQSTMNIFGQQFFLGGEELTDFALGETITLTDRGQTLEAVLADGNYFSIDLFSDRSFGDEHFSLDSILTLTRVAAVPEPGTTVLFAITGTAIAFRRRRKSGR